MMPIKYFAIIKACFEPKGTQAAEKVEFWEERLHIENPDTAEKEAREIVKKFNESLHPGEAPRMMLELLRVESERRHDWEKQNLVTIIKGGTAYDELKCSICGKKTKRYGVSEVGLDGICPGPKSPKKIIKTVAPKAAPFCISSITEGQEVDKTAKSKQKNLDGGEAEAPGPNGTLPEGEGILLAMEITDVSSHEKRGGFQNVPLFGNIGPKGSGRLGTATLHLNNLGRDGMAFIARALGKKPSMKVPVMVRIFIPTGSLLDHWTDMRPSAEEQKEAAKVEKEDKAGEK